MNNHSIYPYNYDQFNPVKTYFNAHVFITALGVKEFTIESIKLDKSPSESKNLLEKERLNFHQIFSAGLSSGE